MRIEIVPISSIKPYENNAKIHTPEQVEQIKNSILEFGNNDPIAIDRDGIIIEGHGRFMALQALGYTEVEVIRLGHLTEDQRKAYTLIHNQLTMNTGFDLETLARELESIEGITMTDYDFELDLAGDDILVDVEEDNFSPEVPAAPTAKLGQVYQLGQHRLMCGDSTSLQDVEKLVGDDQVDMLLTDPPYNVALGYNETPEQAKARRRRTDGLTIENDSMTDGDFLAFLISAFDNAREVMRPGAAHYFTSSRSETTVYTDEIPDFTKMKKDELIQLLQNIYSQATTVIDENKPSRSALHPTMKPLRLMAYCIQNSTKKGEIVLDLFGGSGSTLIAAEQTGRRCYTMEYDPRFVDVIIKRWEEQTGQKAQLLTD